MKSILLAFIFFVGVLLGALLIPSRAHADPVWKTSSTTVRLSHEPCTIEGLREKLVQPEAQPIMVAVTVYQGRVIEACWTPYPQMQSVVVFDADGDIGTIPLADFKESEGL